MAEFYDPIESTRLTHNDEHRPATGRDLAQSESALPLATLERFIEDLRWSQEWRTHADISVDYYDGNQLDAETVAKLEEKGLGPLIRNITKPTVDAVLGLEERTRTDWKVVSDYDDEQEVADALSVKLAEAEREAHADRACSDAYAGQVKAGFAAVEVSRASNPFNYPYRVEPIHRRELYWDPRSRKMDWSDARFVLRKRWFDVDVAAAYFPQQATLIRTSATGSWSDWESVLTLSDRDQTHLLSTLDEARQTTIEELEWRDPSRGRICIYEAWYRVFHRGFVLKLPRGRTVEFNQVNPQHLAIVAAGVVRPIEAVYDKIRCAYFAGPFRLADFGTKRRRFPYIPFWGYREDLTGAPYGLIRSMLSVQDEINARLAKMMWLLASRRTTIDADAPAAEFNTHSDLTREVGRSDAYIVLNPGRRNAKALNIDENLQLAEAQRMALADAVAALPMVSGVYAPLMGNVSNTTAASAIKQLIDQGTTTLAELNGNYASARRMVGEALLELVKEDLSGVEEQVSIDTGVSKRSVYLNRPAQDPTSGIQTVENNTDAVTAKVQLADVPSSQSYRQQQFTQLAEVTKSLPPDVQAFVVPFIIESSDLPQRKQIAKLLREKLGIGLDDGSPEAQQAQQAAEQQAKLEAEQLAKKFDAEMDELKAKTEKLRAEAAKIKADIARSVMDAQAQAAAGGQIDALQKDYEKRLNDLGGQLGRAHVEAANKRMEVQARAETEAAGQREETERERIRAQSAAEVARINGDAQRVEESLRQQIKALGAEVDDRLREIADQMKQAEKPEAKPATKRDQARISANKPFGVPQTERQRS